jgi:hypothetical protein
VQKYYDAVSHINENAQQKMQLGHFNLILGYKGSQVSILSSTISKHELTRQRKNWPISCSQHFTSSTKITNFVLSPAPVFAAYQAIAVPDSPNLKGLHRSLHIGDTH